ncbi:MAG: potassium transporter TrkG [Synergistaceae bacterium]|nr:potassium transporter TrkG [Synergistaceae bacterium]
MIVNGFLLVILVGALLLWLCNNFYYKIPLSIVDALFLSTSAVCVTGLSTIDVASDFGRVTQIILLALIQTGGLGFMTGMMLLTIAIRRRVGIKSQMSFLGGFGVEGLQDAVKLLHVVLCYTLAFEAVGAASLYFAFKAEGMTSSLALFNAVFHSVSAFCNAGFSPIAHGLRRYSMSFVVPGTIMSLIVLGGIGFPVFAECWSVIRNKGRLSYYSRLVLFITSGLLVGGTVLILVSEWNDAFAGMPFWAKLWNALFASVTTRTAGFDTVDPARFSVLGQILMIMLMVVGASPSSTGGGIKTTTVAVIGISVWNEIHGSHESTFRHKKIPYNTERRAQALIVVYIMTFFLAAIVLKSIEDMNFGALVFETASAMGTVGLSVGITPKFSVAGKMILIALMFWGRVGILSFFASLIRPEKGSVVHYPETHIPIG